MASAGAHGAGEQAPRHKIELPRPGDDKQVGLLRVGRAEARGLASGAQRASSSVSAARCATAVRRHAHGRGGLPVRCGQPDRRRHVWAGLHGHVQGDQGQGAREGSCIMELLPPPQGGRRVALRHVMGGLRRGGSMEPCRRTPPGGLCQRWQPVTTWWWRLLALGHVPGGCAGGAQEDSDGHGEGGLPHHGHPRDQDPQQHDQRERRQPARDCALRQ